VHLLATFNHADPRTGAVNKYQPIRVLVRGADFLFRPSISISRDDIITIIIIIIIVSRLTAALHTLRRRLKIIVE
jgi:hypothetical protein